MNRKEAEKLTNILSRTLGEYVFNGVEDYYSESLPFLLNNGNLTNITKEDITEMLMKHKKKRYSWE